MDMLTYLVHKGDTELTFMRYYETILANVYH